MPAAEREQTRTTVRIGIDVGGTFTDLVAFDGEQLRIVKVPSTPPDFERGVIEAIRGVKADGESVFDVVHGSTVATNALLQRKGEEIAFVTTEGFRDMLLIGRQNRPNLYALHVTRPEPITREENFFTIKERVDAQGEVVTAIEQSEIETLIAKLKQRNLKYAAVCFLFSFVNPAHESQVGQAMEREGITVSLSSDVLPEFREYERASTTAINAALRPVVEKYLTNLQSQLRSINNERPEISDLAIMQSTGGTASPDDAAKHAAKMVLSGPAGGVIGAAFMAKVAGFADMITYDMGGTSTDVAAVREATPQWTTQTVVDGLPIALPMFDIHTVGAGGGSIAYRDLGGSLRVGPQSAGALPGPACYGHGGTEPTVTDANVVLGRILPDQFLGGAMKIDADLAHRAVEQLAKQIDRDVITTALGVLKIAEANMASAVREVTSRRGHDPRKFALLSFGGAGGLHACAIADLLEITRIIIPPYCGALSALGMVVAPESVNLSRAVVHLNNMDDPQLRNEFAQLEAALPPLPQGGRAGVRGDPGAQMEYFADVRFRGQSHELSVEVTRKSLDAIKQSFEQKYTQIYGRLPTGREIQLVTLRHRRTIAAPELKLPSIESGTTLHRKLELIDATAARREGQALTRYDLLNDNGRAGPLLLIDPEATTYVPADWRASAREDGIVILEKQ